MPNRYVREAAVDSKAVNSLSWMGECFWRRLINKVDDFGRFTADAELLRGDIFKRKLDAVRETDLPRLLAECEKAGLLFVYTVEAKPFLVMNQWEQGRAKSSKYPPPPEVVRKRMQTFVYTPGQMSPTPTQTPAPAQSPPPTPIPEAIKRQFNQSPSAHPAANGKSDLIKLTLERSACTRLAVEIVGNQKGWAYDNCQVQPRDFQFPKSLATVLTDFVGRVTEAQVHKAWQEAVTRTHKAAVDGLAQSNVGGYCVKCWREALTAESKATPHPALSPTDAERVSASAHPSPKSHSSSPGGER